MKMNKIKSAILRFMAGRYGPDAFYKFLLFLYIALIIVNIFAGSVLIHYLALFVLIYMLFRFFSKNIYKRQEENRKYWLIREKVRKWINLQKNKYKFRKTHIYRKCPSCSVNIKLPKISGNHICTCPKCKTNFNVSVK